MKKTLLTLVLLAGLRPAYAQDHFYKGRVIDKETRLPVAGAIIVHGMDSTGSDRRGHFTIRESGGDSLYIYRKGYQRLSVLPEGDTGAIVVALQRQLVSLATIQVRAFGLDGSVFTNPAAVAALTTAQIQRQGSGNIQDVLNQVAGVQMQERTPGDYRLSVRGSVLQSPWGIRDVKMYWNDIPITTPDNEAPRVLPVSPDDLGRITVIKGPGGSLYGAGLGGVVLFDSKRPAANTQSVSSHAGFGSYGMFQANAVYQASQANFNLSVNYDHLRSDGYRQNNWSDQDALSVQANFYPSANRAVSFFAAHTHSSLGLSGPVDSLWAATTPQKAWTFAADNKTSVKAYDWTLFGLEQRLQLGRQLTNSVSVFGGMESLDHPHGNSSSYAAYLKQSSYHYGLRSSLDWSPWLGAVRSKFSIGAELQFEHEQSNSFALVNDLAGSWPETGTLTAGDILQQQAYLVFARSEFYLPKDLLLTLGGSYNILNYKIDDLVPVGNNHQNYSGEVRFRPVFSPRVALSKSAWDGRMVFRGSVGYGFSPPSVSESRTGDGTFNTALEPEKGLNYELGLRGMLLHRRLNYDLSLYRMNISGLLVPQVDSTGATYYRNTGRALEKGIELSVFYSMIEQPESWLNVLRPWMAVTLNDYRFKDYQLRLTDKNEQSFLVDFSGNNITGVTPLCISAGVDIETRPGFYIYPVLNYYDKTPINDDNTYFQPAYTLLSVKAGYRKTIGAFDIDLALGGQNLLDERYSSMIQLNADNHNSVADPKFYNPSPERNFYVSVSLKYYLKR
ncbi:MAG TPA: TonB-dependent receptor [Edaphocola sp.]|nr:TonB-dependent receptor [Edaphocola sp.]